MKKKWIIILVLYLAGCVGAYTLGKNNITEETGQWTVGNQHFMLGFSTLSWFAMGTVAMENFTYHTQHDAQNQKPASW